MIWNEMLSREFDPKLVKRVIWERYVERAHQRLIEIRSLLSNWFFLWIILRERETFIHSILSQSLSRPHIFDVIIILDFQSSNHW